MCGDRDSTLGRVIASAGVAPGESERSERELKSGAVVRRLPGHPRA